MVETTIKVMTQGEKAKARLARIKNVVKNPGVRVEPADHPDGRWKAEDMRRLLRHPRAGGFRSEGDIEWPNDTFTKRRLKEGSVKLAEEKKSQPDHRRSRQHDAD